MKYRLWSFCMERNGAFLANFPKLNVFHIIVFKLAPWLTIITLHMLKYVVSIPNLFIVQCTLNVWASLTVQKLLRQSTWHRKLQILKWFFPLNFRYTSCLQENVGAVKSQIRYKTVYIALYRSALYHVLSGIETMLFFEKIKGVHRNMILRNFCKIRFSTVYFERFLANVALEFWKRANRT